MPETLVDFMMARPPTAERPLLGVMILLVEDSRFSCEALRLICQRSGARIRRADSLASATRHLQSYRPRVALIDLGLPDGSGLALISQLARADPRIDAIIAMSGDDGLAPDAMTAGADIFLAKPLASVSAFQSTVLSLLPAEIRPDRIARPVDDAVSPDPIALRDDLALAAELLSTRPDPDTLAYLSAFLKSLARDASEPRLADFGAALDANGKGRRSPTTPDQIAVSIRKRIAALSPV